MKLTFLIFLAIHSGLLYSTPNLQTRLEAVEHRLLALEEAIKSSQCQLQYKFHAYRLNRCDKGTFMRSLTHVGSDVMQLECGYYQLVCPETE